MQDVALGARVSERVCVVLAPLVVLMVLAALALAAPLLVGCGGASDVAGGSDSVQDAVSHIPADATFASITDWGTIREQNPDIGSDSDEGLGQLLNVPTNSNLAQYARVMEDDYGWNVVADAEWDLTYANYGTDGGPVINLVKVGDSVDLDDFQARLEEQGFSSKDVEGGTVWTIDIGRVGPLARAAQHLARRRGRAHRARGTHAARGLADDRR